MRQFLLVLAVAGVSVATLFAQKTDTAIPILNPGFEEDVMACGRPGLR
jgi:hypothetical protein